MNNQIANTEIRALDEAELDMVAGGSLFGHIVHAVEHVASSVVHTVENVATNAAYGAFNQPVASPVIGMSNLPGLFLQTIFRF